MVRPIKENPRVSLIVPPKHLTARILEKYYKNLESMDRIDALIAYDFEMHLLYVRYNPHLKYSGKDKNGNPKLRGPRNRNEFVRTKDDFGFPLYVNDLTPELFEKWATGS